MKLIDLLEELSEQDYKVFDMSPSVACNTSSEAVLIGFNNRVHIDRSVRVFVKSKKKLSVEDLEFSEVIYNLLGEDSKVLEAILISNNTVIEKLGYINLCSNNENNTLTINNLNRCNMILNNEQIFVGEIIDLRCELPLG